MTDQDLHTALQYSLVEPVNGGTSYTSGLWSTAEVAAALTRRQRRILVETGLVVSRATLQTIPNTPRHLLPVDYLGLRAASWRSPSGRYTSLLPMTWQEVDFTPSRRGFQTQPRPTGYFLPEDLTRSLELQVVPAAFDGGLVEVWYLAQGAALSNTGVVSLLPDELHDPLVYGTLADLLLKEGRGYDPERAEVCEQFYREGLALTQAALIAGVR